MDREKTYNGVWRGIVVDNDDTKLGTHRHLGRIQVKVEQVYGIEMDDKDCPWAWPCLPMGGGLFDEDDEDSTHGMICIPRIGNTVWVVFEQGDPERPVWIGTWVGKKNDAQEMPQEAVQDQGARYPDISVIKFPHGEKGAFLRCTDNKFELTFEEDNTIKLDKTRKRIYVESEDWEIYVHTKAGNIHLHTEDGSIWLRAGGDITMIAEGSIRAVSGETGHTHALGRNMFSSNTAIHGGAPVASGFDRHP